MEATLFLLLPHPILLVILPQFALIALKGVGKLISGSMVGREVWDHLDHVLYPASWEELVEACNQMSDVPLKDKHWFVEHLPHMIFYNREEVVEALRES